ncbi:DNA polymerase III subunit delta [Tepidibacter formicigenes]|jgi:DNA polymerase-3 subunit delta|uniref:DNA polymerase III subunit delta n=1 Tax=Tepidibacter formicigenes DSM 15518 TaxID=1123349 RepID=A0A1M6LXN8_9FIRM|nr:DNA polymerase III subunit delta [Tepidibacter formicigenes]SHJ75969.1 DNA polymerase III, delta subunit [Tepidibacter formicigenes DSM 15518]
MKYKDIIKDIKSKNFKKLYLFYGKETYLLDNVIKVFKESLNHSLLDFNYSILDGREITMDLLLSNVETLPFMDDRRIIIVKEFELLKNKRKNFTEEDENNLIDYLKNTPQQSTLVFIVYGDIDKRRKLVKELIKQGIVINCDRLDSTELFKWTKNRFEKENVDIGRQEIMYFLNIEDYQNKTSNKTLSDLENQIIKIASFTGKGNTVTKEVIDKLSSKKIENDIFKLIDAIGNKNSSLSMKILNDMILEGESPLMILSMIGRQFRIIIQSKQLQKVGYSSNVIAQKINVHPYVVTKALNQGKNFNNEVIVKLLNEVLDADFSIKNGLIKDTLALEIIISKFCV